MSEASALPGPRLRAEREKRGFSAEKVANELHLDPWVVDALEAADYPRVGPAVFVKGHLKRYAELLGLPPSEIVAGFEAGGGAPLSIAPAGIAPAFGARLPARDDGPKRKNWAPLAVIGCALLALGAAIMLWWKPWQHRAPPTAFANPARAGAGDAGAPADALVPEMPANAAESGAVPAVPVTDAAAAAGHVRLKLSFAAASWVDIRDAEGKRAFSGPGEANSVKTIAGAGPLHVFLGSASDVQVEINDQAVAIGQQFYSGKTARFEAGADGTLRPDAGPPPAAAKVRGASKASPTGSSHPVRPPG